jgi:hypothetical protein
MLPEEERVREVALRVHSMLGMRGARDAKRRAERAYSSLPSERREELVNREFEILVRAYQQLAALRAEVAPLLHRGRRSRSH